MNGKHFQILVILYLAGLRLATAQGFNLIPDPSFEVTKHCPTEFTTISYPLELVHWYSPNKGTPDVFSGCTIGDVGVPNNFAGSSYSKEGSNYAGIFLNRYGYAEYVSTQFTTKLEKDKSYRLQFFLKPSKPSGVLVDSIQILFTSDTLRVEHDQLIVENQAITIPTLFSKNYNGSGWGIANWDFKAKGYEKFLTIGKFVKDSISNDLYKMSGYFDDSFYYYLDYVSLVPIDPKNVFPLNEPFVLNNVLFEFDEYSLKAAAKVALDSLAEFLSNYPEFELNISGHADAVGSQQYNKKLSFRRANSVRKHLVGYGINKKRINVLAFGEEQLVSELDELNRRVEVKIIARDVWGDPINE